MRQILSACFSARIITLVALSSSGFLHATTSVRMHDKTMYQVVTQNGQLCIEHTTMQGELLKMIGCCGGTTCRSASLAIQPDGKLVVAALLQDTSTPTLAVMRYIPTSLQLDTTFGHKGTILLDVVGTDRHIIPVVSVNHDGTIVLLDAADNHSVGCLTAQGRVMRVDTEHDLVDLHMTRASGDCTTGTTGVLTVDKIFCYQDCAPVIFGHRGGVRVMITKKGNQVIEEPLCTQILNEDLGDVVLTLTDFQALISGCTACCDTTGTALTEFQQTWTMLEALEAMLSSKFAQTWTMLADLDATQEFQELFTAIKQDTAILCEKFMETWTILYALNHLDVVVTVSSTVDFSTLFTAIVQTTEFLSEKFMETWTIEVFVDPSELFTAIAENNAIAHQNFQETWTIIEGLQATVCDKFQETWTAIDGVAATLTTKFQETWTMLDAVQTSLSNDFDGVFTVIQDIETDIIAITVTQVNEFIITVSILNKLCTEIIDTLTLINEIVLDIEDTFTALNQIMLGKFQETWTALVEAQDNVIAVKDAQTDPFNQYFAETWTLIAGIDETLTTKFQETWTALAASPCAATLLYTATTISASGTYCLDNNITGTIMIAADNVILDLNGYQVTSVSGNAIPVSGQSNITIRNGYISCASGTNGIHVTNGINILVDRVALACTGSAKGVLVDGVGINKCITVQNSTFLSTASSSGAVGIDINPTLITQLVVQDCFVRGYQTGMSMVAVNSGSVARCTVTNNVSSGIVVQGCNNLTVQGCMINDQTAGDGIRFETTTSTDIVINNNNINNNVGGHAINIVIALSRMDITHNQMMGNSAGIGIVSTVDLASATIIDNIIEGNLAAIATDGSVSNIVIENNQLTNNTLFGLILGGFPSSVTIKNNVIASNGTLGGLVFDNGCQSITIEQNIITANLSRGIFFSASPSSDVVINNNMVSGNSSHGIQFGSGSRSITIANNQINNNTLNGIQATAGLSQSSIIGNQITGDGTNQDIGINLGGSSTTLCIENNCIARHTGVGIATIALTNSVIKNNEITANGSDGIQITDASTDNAIEGNNIADNAGNGIELSSGTGVTISKFLIGGNTIAGNTGNGITITPTDAVTVIFEQSTISNNMISNNGVGINLATTFVGGTLAAQQLCVDANCITGNSSHGINNTAINSIFSNNRSLNNGGSGINAASAAESCSYLNNVCTGNASSGIVNAASYCVFDNNECSRNTGNGLTIGTATGTTPINCTASYNICNNNTVDGIQIASGTNAATVLDHALCKNICNKNGAWGINKLGFANSCSFVLNQCHRNGSAPNFSATISTNFISTYVAATGMMVSKISMAGSEYTNLSIV